MNELFFKLVRSGLYGTHLQLQDLPHNIDWQQIVALAEKQTLLGVVADAVMRLPKEAKVPEEVKKQLMAFAVRIAQTHAMLDRDVAKVVKFFRTEGIDSVLLKGQGNARSYRNPLMRQCGDIDLYVGKKNYERARSLVQQKLESADKQSSESEKHYHFNMGNTTVELHRIAAMLISPIGRKSFQNWMVSELEDARRLRRIDIGGEQICLPSPLFNAVFIFYHAWYHLVYGGIGLRQLCDWTMALDKYHDEIDLDALEKVLRRFRLMTPWQIFGLIAVDQLGLPKEKMPFYNPKMTKKSQKTLDLILEGGNFGLFSKGYIHNSMQVPLLKRKWRTLRKVMNSYRQLAPIMPMEASVNLAMAVPRGALRTVAQLVQGQK